MVYMAEYAEDHDGYQVSTDECGSLAVLDEKGQVLVAYAAGQWRKVVKIK